MKFNISKKDKMLLVFVVVVGILAAIFMLMLKPAMDSKKFEEKKLESAEKEYKSKENDFSDFISKNNVLPVKAKQELILQEYFKESKKFKQLIDSEELERELRDYLKEYGIFINSTTSWQKPILISDKYINPELSNKSIPITTIYKSVYKIDKSFENNDIDKLYEFINNLKNNESYYLENLQLDYVYTADNEPTSVIDSPYENSKKIHSKKLIKINASFSIAIYMVDNTINKNDGKIMPKEVRINKMHINQNILEFTYENPVDDTIMFILYNRVSDKEGTKYIKLHSIQYNPKNKGIYSYDLTQLKNIKKGDKLEIVIKAVPKDITRFYTPLDERSISRTYTKP